MSHPEETAARIRSSSRSPADDVGADALPRGKETLARRRLARGPAVRRRLNRTHLAVYPNHAQLVAAATAASSSIPAALSTPASSR